MKNTKVIAIANQKGGVAKTTSAFNIAAILRKEGYDVLAIDFDPQSSLSNSCLKYEYHNNDITITDLMKSIIERKTIDFKTAVHHNEINNFDYIPSTITLSGVEIDLCKTHCREMVLKRVINNYTDYDYIIIDCPPALGNLLFNALAAADYVLIPVLAQEMALGGIPLLLDSIEEIHEFANPKLEILGVFATWVEKNNNMSFDVTEAVSSVFKDKFLGGISKSKSAQESCQSGIALCNYDRKKVNEYKNKLADEYKMIVEKIKECHRDTKKGGF